MREIGVRGGVVGGGGCPICFPSILRCFWLLTFNVLGEDTCSGQGIADACVDCYRALCYGLPRTRRMSTNKGTTRGDGRAVWKARESVNAGGSGVDQRY